MSTRCFVKRRWFNLKKNIVNKFIGIGLVLPSIFIIIVVITIPIIQSVLLSFQSKDGKYSLENYVHLFSDRSSVNNIIYTLNIVIITVIFTIIFAYLMAMYLRFCKSWFSNAIGKLYLIPKFIPGIVAVYAMMGVINDAGAINRLLLIFGIHFKPSLMYTPQGIILMNLWFNIPFATIIISAALSSIPNSIIESARDVGASKVEIFRRIILPLTAKSALVAITFVFMSNVGSFTTPFLMGSNSPIMLGVSLYQEFGAFYNLQKAAAISVFMFIICSIVGAFYIYSIMKEDKWNIQE